MRLIAYGAISTMVASGVVLQAFHQRANFYSACVHLAQSNACVMILTNFGFFMALMFGKMIQKIFYGPLRPAEVEHLYEKAWYAITETCLAMTIFRDEFHSGFVMMFTILLFLKCFHWLGSDRVDFMEQTPPTRPYLFHTRLASSLILLFLLDVALTRHCVLTLMQLPKPNMLVMFAFEFAILTVAGSSTLARYTIGVVEHFITVRKTRQLRERRKRVLQRRVERGVMTEEEMRDTILEEEEAGDVIGAWEGKSAWLFNMEIATDLVKLTIYLVFFSIVLMFYGLPLHIVRDVYLTIRSFIGRCRDFIRYKKATAQMNSRYPDATREEIAREAVCIICREDMVAWVDTPGAEPERLPGQPEVPVDEEDVIDERLRPKKLPCGHVLHLACLKSWMERQQRCPTCRRPVLEEPGAQPQGQGPEGAGVQNPGANVPQGGQQGNQQGQGQGQGQDQVQGQGQQGQAPGQPQQPDGGPVGFGFNMLGGPGGLVQALARNLAQRQNGLQPLFDQNAQGVQQRNQQAQQNQVPGQQNQPAAQQNRPAQQNQQAQPTQPAQGVEATQRPSGNDIVSQLNDNAAQMVRVAINDVVNQQNAWNQRLLEQMFALRGELRTTMAELRVNPPQNPPVPTPTTAAAASDTPAQSRSANAQSPSIHTLPRGGLPSNPPPPPPPPSFQAYNIPEAAQPYPPDFQLPPGWSIIPLYPVAQGRQAPSGGPGSRAPSGFATPQQQQQGVVYSTPSPIPHQQHQPSDPAASTSSATNNPLSSPPVLDPADISLSSSRIRRRGVQRQYSSNLHTYHSMASPRREEPNPFAPFQEAPTSSAVNTSDSTTGATSSSSSSGPTRNQQTANSSLNNISSSPRHMNNSPNHGTSSSPSRHGSISSTSREVLERRHRDAHSPRPGYSLSPAGSVRSNLSNSNSNNHPTLQTSTTDSSARRASSPMGSGGTTATGNGHRSEQPHLDTSAEHNHPLDSTHDPTQGRSPIEERRRASAGEILLSETDTVWPAASGSGPTSEASLSPTPSLPGSRVGSIRRNRRSSGAGLAAAMAAGGSGSPVGTTSMFNVIPKSQASSTVSSPVIGHMGRFDLGSPTRMSLDKGKEKDDSRHGGNEGGASDDKERGRSRIKEEEDES